jgi:hypothetical protein
MMDAKKAAEVAASYFAELYTSADPSSIRLEEVELAEGEQCWRITLSFIDRVTNPFAAAPDRRYKVFEIDAVREKVLSMKIRQLERA